MPTSSSATPELPQAPQRRGTTTRRSVCSIGNFDGVHRGHLAVLARAAADAERRGMRPVALTFDPHPSLVLGREPPARLTTNDRRRELLARALPALEVVVRRFDAAVAAMSAEVFVRQVLLGELDAGVVVVGRDFRFGQGRTGDFATLERLGKQLGFEAQAMEILGDDSGAWSSTRVRSAIVRGDFADVERVLGRPHALTGVVAHGDGLAKKLGYPTANLTEVTEMLPPFGIYAVVVDRVAGNGSRALARGVASIGLRPTVQSGFAIEAHLFDFDASLYDAVLRLHLVAYLRPERKFDDLAALTRQIGKDAETARHCLADRGLGTAPSTAWF